MCQLIFDQVSFSIELFFYVEMKNDLILKIVFLFQVIEIHTLG